MTRLQWFGALRGAMYLLAVALMLAVTSKPAVGQSASDDEYYCGYDDNFQYVCLEGYLQMDVTFSDGVASEISTYAETDLDFCDAWEGLWVYVEADLSSSTPPSPPGSNIDYEENSDFACAFTDYENPQGNPPYSLYGDHEGGYVDFCDWQENYCDFEIDGYTYVSVADMPSIGSISPTSDAVGNSNSLDVSGTNLIDPSNCGTDPYINDEQVTLTADANEQCQDEMSYDVSDATVNYSISNSDTPATDTFWVSNGSGISNDVTFTVTPSIASISPTYAMVGSNNVQVTMSGKGFGNTEGTVNLPSGFTLVEGGCDIWSTTQIISCVNISVNTAISSVNFSVTASGVTSNNIAFTADGPNYMEVTSDVMGSSPNCGGNWPGQCRLTSYQVFTRAGYSPGGIYLAENVIPGSDTCQPNNGFAPLACNSSFSLPADGSFTDSWPELNSNLGYGPPGCNDNLTDHWQWCGLGAPSVPVTFGTLVGWFSTSSVNILGYIMPGNPIPPGTVINP